MFRAGALDSSRSHPSLWRPLVSAPLAQGDQACLFLLTGLSIPRVILSFCKHDDCHRYSGRNLRLTSSDFFLPSLNRKP